MKKYNWVYNEFNIYSKDIEIIASKTGLSKIQTAVAMNRGYKTEKAIKEYLQKSFECLHSSFLLSDIDKAVKRINKAVDEKEKIFIYGDYDVDGITSVSILFDYLKSKGADVDYYIPGRFFEGYGINFDAIDRINAQEGKLVITVDTGITAAEECEYIKSLGIDVIITDHHECKEVIPNCVAVVNPKRPDCEYPFKFLAGVGVVFKLLCALEGDAKAIFDKYGEIVAFGTVADVVSLKGENRIIVNNGLPLIEKTKNVGLRALIDASGLADRQITINNVGFNLAPKINAAGRLSDAGKAVSLFLEKDKKRAAHMAEDLCEDNRQRQTIENEIMTMALDMIEKNPLKDGENVVVLWHKDWHQGIIGIVASRISEKFYRPSVLISVAEGIGKGSGRSIKEFNLFAALQKCSGLLEKFGGHEQAAGLSLKEENLEAFKKALNEAAKLELEGHDLRPSIAIDCELPMYAVSLKSAEQMDIFEPTGIGNPKPCFSVMGCTIKNIYLLSEGKHISLVLSKNDRTFDAVGFSMGNLSRELKEGSVVNIAGALTVNEWNGKRKMQLVIKDIMKI